MTQFKDIKRNDLFVTDKGTGLITIWQKVGVESADWIGVIVSRAMVETKEIKLHEEVRTLQIGS